MVDRCPGGRWTQGVHNLVVIIKVKQFSRAVGRLSPGQPPLSARMREGGSEISGWYPWTKIRDFISAVSRWKERLVPWRKTPNGSAKQSAAYCLTVSASMRVCCITTQIMKLTIMYSFLSGWLFKGDLFKSFKSLLIDMSEPEDLNKIIQYLFGIFIEL